MRKAIDWREQLRRNAVALISLAVAIMSLGYNTWRNEASEHNRNQRWAAFEVLMTVGELQELVFYLHYDRDRERGNPRAGWALVLTTRDVTLLLEEPVQAAAQDLYRTWAEHWDGLGSDADSADAVLGAIESMRAATRASIERLR